MVGREYKRSSKESGRPPDLEPNAEGEKSSQQE